MTVALSALAAQTPSFAAVASSGSSASQTSSTQGPNGLLNPQTFLQLLVDQLKYQNPLNPTSGSQLMSQVAQLSQVEALQQVSQNTQTQAGADQAMAAASLIGKAVTGIDSAGNPLVGVVSQVQMSSGNAVLDVGGKYLPLSQVATISAAAAGA